MAEGQCQELLDAAFREPVGCPPPVKKKESKKKRGGQPGHPPHLKQLLPPEQVTRTETIVPVACEHCQAALPSEEGHVPGIYQFLDDDTLSIYYRESGWKNTDPPGARKYPDGFYSDGNLNLWILRRLK